MDKKSLFSIKDTAFTLTSVLPVVFSMAICAGMGSFAGALFACIATLICASSVEEKKQMPIYVSLLIVTFTFKEFGASATALSISVCGILLVISSLFYDKIKEAYIKNAENSVVGSVMLSCAIVATILFTTDYFSIGATGNTSKEMIESYLSLGFHPNWRGVLYGTIVLVVMITFPRKFKKATKIISAPFIALIITTILNLFLNPSDMISSIREVGYLNFEDFKNILLLPVLSEKPTVVFSVFSGLSLFVTAFYFNLQNKNTNKTDIVASGVLNCISGFSVCMFIPAIARKRNIIGRIIAAITAGAIFFVFYDFIARTPVSSCAVVIIVGVWQSVKWSEVKKIFSSLQSVFIFMIIIAFALVKEYTYVPLIALVAETLISKVSKKINTCG